MAAARSTTIVPLGRPRPRYPEALLHKRHEMRLRDKKPVTIQAAADPFDARQIPATRRFRQAHADSPSPSSAGKTAHFRGFPAESAATPAILVDTGCRLGEGLGLIWNDVQGARASFWITKSGRSRTVPLTLRAQKAAGIPRGRLKGPFAMLRQVRYRAIWNEAKAEIGLGADEQVVPHILRHTCASRLVQGGIDMRRIQMWLGHQTLQMTMRYAHLATHDLDSCVVVLENPVRRPAETAAAAASRPRQEATDAERMAGDDNSFPAAAAEG